MSQDKDSAANGVYTHDVHDKKEGRDLMRMSLSSSITGGLDVADLSSVWNRNPGGDNDALVTEEIKEKYKMDKWLCFLDQNIEEDFFEKYFYNSIKTHRAFCLIVPSIYALFILLSVFGYNVPVLIMHFILGGGTLCVYFYLKSKNARDHQLKIVFGIVFYHAIGVGIERPFGGNDVEPNYLQINNGRSFAVFYIFVLYSAMMSLRFTVKIIAKIWIGIMINFFIIISLLRLTEPEEYADCTFFLGIISLSLGTAAYSTELGNRNQEIRRAAVLRHTEEVAKEKMITEKLLLNILPSKIARRLMDGEEVIADQYENVTVLFADLVGWTEIARSMSPVESIELLNEIVSNIDRLTLMYKMEKIKTIGDGYLVACGLPEPMEAAASCKVVANFALDMIEILNTLSKGKKRSFQMTIGMHTGSVVAGVIGKTKFLYDLWGDSVNTASRMQSHGDTNRIHVTSRVYDLLNGEYEFEKRPVMEIKGKGEMQTYFLLKRTHEYTGHGNNTTVIYYGNESSNQTDSGANPQSGLIDVRLAQNHEEAGEKMPQRIEVKDEKMEHKLSRKDKKAREAIQKKNQELDEQLDSQIKSKWSILNFVDKNLEEKFRKTQDMIVQERMMLFTGFLVFIELIAGLDIYAFDADHIQVYYMVFGPCACVQVVNAIVGYYAPRSAMGLSTFNLMLNRLSILILYGYYRSLKSPGIRFIHFLNVLTMVVTYNSSQVPYRIVRRIEFTTWFLYVLVMMGVNGDIGLDNSSTIMYLGQCFYGQETCKHVEKQARREFLLSEAAEAERVKVIKQREESERLLHNILPESLINRLRDGSVKLIDTYETASVMFADICGFTVLSSKLDASSIVKMLNGMFSQVDEAAERLGMEKIKTIGDAYMVVAGLPYPRPDHAKVAVMMALEMVRIVQSLPDVQGLKVNVRIGVHSGPVVGGMIGASKMVFDIWGNNVNVASKMESSGSPGCVNVSHVTRNLIGECADFEFEKRDKTYKYGDQTYELYFVRPANSQVKGSTGDW